MNVRLQPLSAAVLAMLLVVPIALAAKLPGGAKYSGKVDDGTRVRLTLSKNAGRVKQMRIDYKVSCNDGTGGKTFTVIRNPRVRADATFKGSGKYQGSVGGDTNRFKVAGKLSAKRATGTFSLTSVGSPASVQGPVRCKTGQLHWRATRTN
jgi:hypothetical protein